MPLGRSMRAPLKVAPTAAPPQRAHAPVLAASDTTVVEADWKFAAACVALGPLILLVPWLFGGFFTLLGLLLVVQTLRIRFVFVRLWKPCVTCV